MQLEREQTVMTFRALADVVHELFQRLTAEFMSQICPGRGDRLRARDGSALKQRWLVADLGRFFRRGSLFQSPEARCDSSFSTLVSQVLPASIRDRALQAAPVSGQAPSDQCAARYPGGIIRLFIFVDTTLGLRGFRHPQQRKTATHSTREFV